VPEPELLKLIFVMLSPSASAVAFSSLETVS